MLKDKKKKITSIRMHCNDIVHDCMHAFNDVMYFVNAM